MITALVIIYFVLGLVISYFCVQIIDSGETRGLDCWGPSGVLMFWAFWPLLLVYTILWVIDAHRSWKRSEERMRRYEQEMTRIEEKYKS